MFTFQNNVFYLLLLHHNMSISDQKLVSIYAAPHHNPGKEITEGAFMSSLENLGLEYVDLYLIYFPSTGGMPVSDGRQPELHDQTWAKLTEMYDDGKAKAIGVSNFTVKHLRQLLSHDHGVKPAVNQVEWHPYYYQPELVKFCEDHDIVLQAYCSFGGTSANNFSLLQDPVVRKIAEKMQVTYTQLLLGWAVQQGVAVIPKSTNPLHIKQNISLDFKISPDVLKDLNSLGKKNIKYAWNPSDVV